MYHRLGIGRKGLRIDQAELPLRLGAFHQVSSNRIVVNRRLLETAQKASGSLEEYNSFVFSILLHEYLHSLGYINESLVRWLVAELSYASFGKHHPATKFAMKDPWIVFNREIEARNGKCLHVECQGDYWIYGH